MSGVDPVTLERSFDTADFRRCCGQFLIGITVVTTRSEDATPVGCTANSFTLVSPAHPWSSSAWTGVWARMRASFGSKPTRCMCSAGDQVELSRRFATRGAAKVAGLDVRTGLGGVPVLPRYLAPFECTLAHLYDGGDHGIFIGQVARLDPGDPAGWPLGFMRGKHAYVDKHAPALWGPGGLESGGVWSLGWS